MGHELYYLMNWRTTRATQVVHVFQPFIHVFQYFSYIVDINKYSKKIYYNGLYSL